MASLWRYPVKSMQGEALQRAEVGAHGIAGDRQWAVVDRRTGLALTARRQPELLHAAAALDGDDVRITLPTGAVARSDADLSDWLGRPVALERASEAHAAHYETPLDPEHEDGEWASWRGPAGSFHDSGRTQLSLVSTATLRDWDVRRFRPNVVLDGAGEDALVGSVIALGSTRLDVVKQIDRCVVVSRPQPGLDADLGVLRTINRERATFLGVGVLVALGGSIAVGDEVRSSAGGFGGGAGVVAGPGER